MSKKDSCLENIFRWVGLNVVTPTKEGANRVIAAKQRQLQEELIKVLRDQRISKEEKKQYRTRYKEQAKQVAQ